MSMKNKINKLVSLLMVFFMTFGLFAPLASAEITIDQRGTIEIKNVAEDVLITAYRLMNVNYDFDKGEPTTPVYEWVDGLSSWMETNFPDYADAENFTDDVVGKEKEDGTTYPTADEVYDAIAAAIRSGVLDLKESGHVDANKDGEAVEIGNLEMGNYLLLIENGLKVYKPAAVNVIPVWNADAETWEMSKPAAEVDVKSSEVGIVKTIVAVNGDESLDTVSIWDTVTYRLSVDIPKYPVNSKYKTITVSDKITDVLSIDMSSLEVYVGESIDLLEEIASDNYTITENSTLLTDNGVATNFSIDFEYEALRGHSKIIMQYDAFVSSDVVIGPEGNLNTGYLEYSTNPYGSNNDTLKMTSDDVTIYSYGIVVNKTDDKTNSPLSGAIFTISESKSGETSRENYSFVKEEDGVYRRALESDTDTVTELEVNANGVLRLKGLRAGTYYLAETKAPGGYNRLKDDVEIIINDEENGERDGIVEIANTDEEGNTTYGTTEEGKLGYRDLTVGNKKGFSLPETGGIGTIIFTVVGIVLMGVGVIIFKKIRNRENN